MRIINCNYITIDGHTALICKNNGVQKSDQSQTIPNIPPKLLTQLEKLGQKIGEVAFVVVPGVRKGEIKLFKNADYEQVAATLPQPILEIKKSTSINIITFKENPCVQQIYIDGILTTVYRRDINC